MISSSIRSNLAITWSLVLEKSNIGLKITAALESNVLEKPRLHSSRKRFWCRVGGTSGIQLEPTYKAGKQRSIPAKNVVSIIFTSLHQVGFIDLKYTMAKHHNQKAMNVMFQVRNGLDNSQGIGTCLLLEQ